MKQPKDPKRRQASAWTWIDQPLEPRIVYVSQCRYETSTGRRCVKSYLHGGGHSTKYESRGARQ